MMYSHFQRVYAADSCLQNRSSTFAVTHFPVTLSSFYVNLYLYFYDAVIFVTLVAVFNVYWIFL